MDIKQPPFSKEAEQSVLGGLLLGGDNWLQVADSISEDDFYNSEHRIIFTAIKHLSDNGKESDAITVGEYLEGCNRLDDAGGLTHLVQLANNCAGTSNLKAYARIVKEKSVLRNVLRITNNLADMVYFPDGRNADSIIEHAYDALRLVSTETESDIPSIGDTIGSAISQLEYRFNNAGKITGVETGFEKLDKTTIGWQKGELYILAGRPAMGKSTFALNVCTHAALNGKHVLFFSLEMPKERIIDKCASSIGSVPYENIKTGSMNDSDWGKVGQAMTLIGDSGLRIDDRGGQTLSSIVMKCKKLHSKRKLDLIVIDYLQLVRVIGASRYDEVSEVSRELKSLAKNLECPVIALSQLSRNVESRNDKRPKLSDLRESGQIEQDADLIAFLYRDEVYYPEHQESKGITELLIEKHRFGELGKILLRSELAYSRFANAGDINYQPYSNEKKSVGFNG